MGLKFATLTRPNIRKLEAGQRITEHGITFERLPNKDGVYSVNIMVDGQRIHRRIGKESAGVTREQCEQFIEKARTDARQGRLNLPKGRTVALGFAQAAAKYLEKLEQEGGKDLPGKCQRLTQYLVPFFLDKSLAKISTFDVERYKKTEVASENRTGA
jgi:hypothetical protein